MNTILIKSASIHDMYTLQFLGRETFFETFAQSNSAADMAQYLEESFSEEKISQELNNPGSSFFIAWEREEPIGYIKLNTGRSQTIGEDEDALEIERIYVKAAFHGKKIGQLLYDKALEIAHIEGKSYLWLGVWGKNPRAISFYEKNGFVQFDTHIFRLGNDEQTDILMKKSLKE